jgi:hypothetical protein
MNYRRRFWRCGARTERDTHLQGDQHERLSTKAWRKKVPAPHERDRPSFWSAVIQKVPSFHLDYGKAATGGSDKLKL